MTDRVVLAVKFTPVASAVQVRKAVGGFLRYVQHRDVHPAQSRPRPSVAGLLKYVAYRDRASTRAEMFGPSGALTSTDRKAFAAFVAGAVERSKPQLFRGRDGQLRDRRRAVYRLVISPERAAGLDLRRLTAAAVQRLEADSGMTGLPWIAAVHRNTAHHHVHLVIAGVHFDGTSYRRVDITRPRLAAMKEAVANEITRERGTQPRPKSWTPITNARRPLPPRCHIPFGITSVPGSPASRHRSHYLLLVALRAVARRYRRQVERDAREEVRTRGWEVAV